jgi:hypothetical protein
MCYPSKPTGDGASMVSTLEAKRKERKKMVHAEVLEKQKKILEIYGPARAKRILTETIHKFSLGLPWINKNCYTYYVRQLKAAPEEIITTSTSDDQLVSNVSGLTSSQNDTPLVAVNMNMSDASPTGTHLNETFGSPRLNITDTEVPTTPHDNADEGSFELSVKENSPSSGTTAMDKNSFNAKYQVSSSSLGGGGERNGRRFQSRQGCGLDRCQKLVHHGI